MARHMSPAIARALKMASLHPAVVGVEVADTRADGSVIAIFCIKTELWSSWRTVGESPSGVREIEPVSLTFSQAYPAAAPKIALRQDFRRDHPHLMPGPADQPPVPCIVDGRVNELIELRGIEGLVEQLAEWLERAAMRALNDPDQGWEPVRRDGIDDWIVIDGDNMRRLINPAGGACLVRIVFVMREDDDGRSYLVDHRSLDLLSIGTAKFGRHLTGERQWAGNAAGIIVWAADETPGKFFVVDTYAPETVTTLGDLRARAAFYGCRAQFDSLVDQIGFGLLGKTFEPTPLTVTFLVRRPFDVVGTTSPIEICSYLIHVRSGEDLIQEDRPIVRLCATKDRLSLPILRRASGEDETPGRAPWTLLGCGSVGSKIALHMARRGFGPSRTIDCGSMSPHNFARHALLPDPNAELFWQSKAEKLANALATLEQRPEGLAIDAVVLSASPEGRAVLCGIANGLLDTTASTVLRERLAFLAWEHRPAIGQAHLLGAGKGAYAAFEGADGNPNVSDLAVEFYRLIARDGELAETVFSAEAEAVAVGQGCSAFTFPMPDDRLSTLTAGLSQVLAMRHFPRQTADGEIRLGILGEDGLSQTWTREVVPPWIIVQESSEKTLGVRLSARVDAQIRAEIAARPSVETGGVLIGRFSQAANVFQIVDVLPAPPDSSFSPEKFVLGTQGLRAAIEDVIRASHGTLYVLGTWHNHLGDFGPSVLDAQSAISLALRQFFPVLMLIALPEGYACVTAEFFDPDILAPSSGGSQQPTDEGNEEKIENPAHDQ